MTWRSPRDAAVQLMALAMFFGFALAGTGKAQTEGQYALVASLVEKTTEMESEVASLEKYNRELATSLAQFNEADSFEEMKTHFARTLGALQEAEAQAQGTRRKLNEVIEGLDSLQAINTSDAARRSVQQTVRRLQVSSDRLSSLVQSGSSQVQGFADISQALHDIVEERLREAERQLQESHRLSGEQSSSESEALRSAFTAVSLNLEALEVFYGVVRGVVEVRAQLQADVKGYRSLFDELFGSLEESSRTFQGLKSSGDDLLLATSSFITSFTKMSGDLSFENLGVEDEVAWQIAGIFVEETESSCSSCRDGIDNDRDGLADSQDPKCEWVEAMFESGVWSSCPRH